MQARGRMGIQKIPVSRYHTNMAKKPMYQPEHIAQALLDTGGMVTFAAQRANVCVNTVYRYIERYDEVSQALTQARNEVTDKAENKLFDAIEAGEPWAITFYLKNKARDRGYGEKVEHTGEVKMKIDWDEMYRRADESH